ncbi:MAG: amidohydrolase family protein [Eubacteriales bacterium]|nr:amidohydrolase family protein [Eubacteriales bacterium]
MFGECHAHLIMDGLNYHNAVGLHARGVREDVIRERLEEYRKAGVFFIRDGGDSLGVSKRAKELAAEYGIDYRTPVFAIHKEGHYGSIVGRGFTTMKEYHKRVLEAKAEGADFIKIMTTGLLDFNDDGEITGEPLDVEEVKEMVHVAHEEGFSVMSHTNGVYGVRAALEAGIDSIEHGNYMDEETILMLSQSNTVWVPTLVTVRNLLGCGRYEDDVIRPIMERAAESVALAFDKGVRIALGSDAGAYMVPHGKGIQDEYRAFTDILGHTPKVDEWIRQGEKEIKERFRAG